MTKITDIKVEINFDGAWVLKHRDDEELPVEALENRLSTVMDGESKIINSTLTTLTVICKGSDEELKKDVLEFLNERYPEEDIAEVMYFKSTPMEKDGADGDPEWVDDVDSWTERREDPFGEDEDGETDNDDSEDSEDNDDNDDNEDDSEDEESGVEPDEPAAGSRSASGRRSGGAIDKINALVGAEDFKALAREISAVASEVRRAGNYDVFMNQCYLVSIGDGCGLTTFLELFAELIAEQNICRISDNPVIEVSLGAYREHDEPFEEAKMAIDNSPRNVKIVCVDISEWMDKLNNRYFKKFLRSVEKHILESVVVFRVPFVDKDILERIRRSLSDSLSIKTLSFPPLSQREIKEYAEDQFKLYGFTVTRASWEYFFSRVSEERSDGKFYGISTIKKIVRELVYNKHLANSKKRKKSDKITAADAKTLCVGFEHSNLSGKEQLERLVGMESVKARLEEIIAQIVLSMQLGSDQRPSIHMRFAGNPGTGKTTVARIMGKILKERGVLRVGAFFEYSGRDFCGRYIGETAPKTASICRDAYGSVLFIDEAYSLYRGDDDTRDYGREAIDTLIAEMENHRNDLIVIMSGYTDDMEKLMGGNQGLASRMPYLIEFPNFTREQLYEIFVSMAQNKFKCDDGLFAAAREYFLKLPEDIISAKEFSNGRYVRNLFERTWAKAAMRCQLNGLTNVVLMRDDFEQAAADKEFLNNKKSRIGF